MKRYKWFIIAVFLVLFSGLQLKADEAAKGKQTLPLGDFKNGGFLRCIVQEDNDQDFNIILNGEYKSNDGQLFVVGPDNKLLFFKKLPPKKYENEKIPVAKDGQTGQYVIFLRTKDGKDTFYPPLTSLSKEIYSILSCSQLQGSTWYIGGDGQGVSKFTVTPSKSSAVIKDKTGKVLGKTANGLPLTVEIPPEGALLTSKARYLKFDDGVGVIALSEKAWFVPESEKKKMKIPSRKK